ncbi:MAG: hypothetical protein LUH14_04475 [Clostridiaceae bacterium]|nr:hypothetical protein [Clostridiaceae bacterium]
MALIMKSTKIADTTKEERIALIKSWQPEDEALDGSDDVDIWEIYKDYINGTKEIAECNAEFAQNIEYY